MLNKHQHFVPQYYLRQFRSDGTNRVLVCLVEPYRCVGLGGIKGQCQRDHFYGKDSVTDEVLRETEQQIAPTLYAVNSSHTTTTEEWQTLRLLAVQLHLRTNKAAERAKVFPRFVADKLISTAIKKGHLPPPLGGWQESMMDFEGVPQMLLGLNLLSCYLETATLRCKLLRAAPGECFITSDHPAIALNQFAVKERSVRDYVGFAQAGFQLLLPLSPALCAFFYDPFVYKVGNRNDRIVELNASDVEIVNSLQVQSAEKCLYAHQPEQSRRIEELVAKYCRLRMPLSAGIKSHRQNENATLLMFSDPPPVLSKRWQFCSYLANIRRAVGDRRDPGHTHLVQLLIEDIERTPKELSLDERIARIVRNLPHTIPVVRRPELLGIQLPQTRKDWKVGM